MLICYYSITVITVKLLFTPGGRAQGRHPRLEDAHEEGVRVLPAYDKVDQGQEDASVDDEAHHHGDHVHAQLPGNHLQVSDGDDLAADEAGDTEGRVPADTRYT